MTTTRVMGSDIVSLIECEGRGKGTPITFVVAFFPVHNGWGEVCYMYSYMYLVEI